MTRTLTGPDLKVPTGSLFNGPSPVTKTILSLDLFKLDPDLLAPVFQNNVEFPETQLNRRFHQGVPGNPPVGLFVHVFLQFIPVFPVDKVFQFLCTPHNGKKYPVSRTCLEHVLNFFQMHRIAQIDDGRIPVSLHGIQMKFRFTAFRIVGE